MNHADFLVLSNQLYYYFLCEEEEGGEGDEGEGSGAGGEGGECMPPNMYFMELMDCNRFFSFFKF